jgi:hypothetical protein
VKGLVFTELLEYLESQGGLKLTDRIITGSNLPSGGAYTAVGTYDSAEMLSLVGTISSVTGKPAREILLSFGHALFPRLLETHPNMPGRRDDAFSLLEDLHGIIHVEVRKLYPDAELPSFRAERLSANRMRVSYESTRPFADLAEGLIRGCCAHFGEAIEMTREPEPEGRLDRARFVLTRVERSDPT